MLLAPLSELAVSQLWSPSQCFFGAEMTELGPTFKDNCLIGAFSYAVGSWGPEKGSDNSVIMRLQQICTFVAELWRMSWQPCALSTSTCPPWALRYSWSKAFFNKNTVEYWLCEWVCIVRTHDCISGNEWDVRLCLIPPGFKVCPWKNLSFYSCYTSNVSSVKGGRTLLHSTSSSL